MPQMAPLWWEFMFFMFITSFLLMNTMIYFMKPLNSIKNYTKMKIVNQIKWKW
nr:ATP synthase subunit 8 [Cnemomis nodulosa]